ncbi:MAG: phytoene desaturase family protein [Bernardetiaceae bacterium]
MKRTYDVLVIGTGMGSLTAACLLAKEGLKIGILEQNYLPGGCTSSYWRRGYVFESGATTLVGLDQDMPLHFLLQEIGVHLPAVPLSLPMEVRLKDGTRLPRHQNLNDWISEAERAFGKHGQRAFWEFAYRVSQFVWRTSLRQRHFPPARLNDLWQSVRNATPEQLRFAPWALVSMKQLLKRYGLLENERFVDFCNEQLLITAQNHVEEVNVLFGATALCYTNYGNYYMPGGLINLVQPLLDYLTEHGAEILYRYPVQHVSHKDGRYHIAGKREDTFESEYLISGIPLNNTLEIYPESYTKKYQKQRMDSPQLNSAFQVGIGFEAFRDYETIHYQIHLPEPLPETGSKSIFLSLSHPDDQTRSKTPGHMVASVSTHLPDPASRMENFNKAAAEEAVLETLDREGLIRRDTVKYYHSSAATGWEKWTKRAFGFVGGYPQYLNIKPWQMAEARLDGKKGYICGDTVYPGQGIPGTVLSGIIAAQKLKSDHLS